MPEPLTLADAYARLNMQTLLLSKDAPNRSGVTIKPQYVTIHETDNEADGADAMAHSRYMAGADARARKVSWHFSVDTTKVIKHLPTTEKAWHAGTAEGNNKSVGIEICVNRGGTFYAAACDRAALLAAVLLDSWDFGVDRLRQHENWSGKDCPSHLRAGDWGLDWADFKTKVSGYLDALNAADLKDDED